MVQCAMMLGLGLGLGAKAKMFGLVFGFELETWALLSDM